MVLVAVDFFYSYNLIQTQNYFIMRSFSLNFVRYFVPLLFFIFISSMAVAQRNKVTGTVKDNNDLPLPGVSVVVQGTPRGVITDIDGTFSIDVSPKDKLVFSFLGMETTIVEVGTQTNLNVKIQEQKNTLDEVTVVGFGKQRKTSVIGAITSVSVNDLKIPVGNISTSLAGKMAGVVAMQRTGEPGSSGDFWIRGVGTFGTNNRPLILVDGVERPLDLVDNEDIETFSILKDATATAVYGVRGANGVVLITTRKGTEGKPRINVKTEYGFLSPTKMPKMANAVQWIDLYNELYREKDGHDFYSTDDIQKFMDGSDPDLYPNVDWIKEIYKTSTTNQKVNINVTGGTSNIKYYVSGAYYGENGIYNAHKSDFNPSMRWQRFNFRTNLDIDLSKNTVLNINMSIQYDVKNRPNSKSGSTDLLWINSYQVTPVAIPPIYSDGTLARPMSAGVNPYNTLNKTGYVQEFNNNAQSLIGLTHDFSEYFIDGLKLNAKFSWDVVNNSNIIRSLNPSTYFATGRDDEGKLIFHKNNEGSDYMTFSKSNMGNRIIYAETSLTYDRVFDSDHRVGGLLLFNLREKVNNIPSTYNESLPYRNLGLAGRLTYSFKDKYFIEGNFGYNGSENFAPSKRFGLFPSVAVGYLMSSEKFFEPLLPVIDLLKFKVSYGKIGNDQIGDGTRRFAFNSDMNQSAGGYVFGESGKTNLTGVSIGYPGNSEVSWEQSTKTNVGIEFSLFRQLKFQVDYFEDSREKIFILKEDIPSVEGISVRPYLNLGKMKNQGIDASLEYFKKIGNFSISGRGNFTYNRNEKLYDDKPTPVMLYQDLVGRPLYQQFGFVSLGYFESEEDILNSPRQMFGPVRPGDVKFRDINGDGVINEYDKIAIGRTHVPEINYGFGISVGWKGLDVSFFFQGVGNVTGFLDGNPVNGFEQNAYMAGVFEDIVVNRWRPENPDPNAKYPRMALEVSQNNKQLGTHKQRDMSFMRLKNAEIGYTIPKQITNKIRVSTLRIYIQGVNLLNYAKFDLWDPEIGNSQGAVYPNMRTISCGVNLNF